MRRSELLNAKWRDVNWKDHTLRIPVAKNGHARTIPLAREALSILSNLGNVHDPEARIFPLSCESVKLAWKRLVTRAKIGDLHFHDLRHEAVSRFFELGLTLPEVALISGHKDPRMLFRYTHLKADKTLYACEKYAPAGQQRPGFPGKSGSLLNYLIYYTISY